MYPERTKPWMRFNPEKSGLNRSSPLNESYNSVDIAEDPLYFEMVSRKGHFRETPSGLCTSLYCVLACWKGGTQSLLSVRCWGIVFSLNYLSRWIGIPIAGVIIFAEKEIYLFLQLLQMLSALKHWCMLYQKDSCKINLWIRTISSTICSKRMGHVNFPVSELSIVVITISFRNTLANYIFFFLAWIYFSFSEFQMQHEEVYKIMGM